MLSQPAHHNTSHSKSRKCSTSSHREPCVMTSLKDHDSECDIDNHEIYMKHQQQQCAQACYLTTHDIQLPNIHTRDHQISLHAPIEDNMNTRETTEISKLAGIHKPYLFSPSQVYERAGIYSDNSKCAVVNCNRSPVSDYNRPAVENVPMAECSVPCETSGYFVLQHQS